MPPADTDAIGGAGAGAAQSTDQALAGAANGVAPVPSDCMRQSVGSLRYGVSLFLFRNRNNAAVGRPSPGGGVGTHRPPPGAVGVDDRDPGAGVALVEGREQQPVAVR